MNTEMHGKPAQSIEFYDTMAGNPVEWKAGVVVNREYIARVELSATHHGDHDEFWFVAIDANGNEIARRNAKYVEHVTWVRP